MKKIFIFLIITLSLACVAYADDGIIIRGSLDFEENFEGAVDSVFVPINQTDISVIDEGSNKALQILGHSKTIGTNLFGNDLANYILEADIKQESANGTNSAGIIFTLRGSGGANRIYGTYTDVMRLDTSTMKYTASAPVSRDSISLSYGTSSFNLGNLTFVNELTSGIGILNTTPRSFSNYYKFTTAAVDKIGGFSVKSLNGNLISSTRQSYSNVSNLSTSGKSTIGVHATQTLIDNIKVYNAYYAKRLELILEKSAVYPGSVMSFEVRAYKNDTDYIIINPEYLTFDYDNIAFSVNTIDSTVESYEEFLGDFYITVTGTDYLNGTEMSDMVSFSVNYDAEDVVEAANALTVANIAVSDFSLPLTGLNSTTISWVSSNTDYISIIGGNATVVRPSHDENDVVVKLTATITKNTSSLNKYFMITVKRELSTDELFDNVISQITIADKVSGSSIVLPRITEDGVEIIWTSKNTQYISNNGIVTRPKGSDVTVALEATLVYGEEERTVRYNVVVQGLNQQSYGGGGGGGRSVTITAPPVIPDNTKPTEPKKEYADLYEADWAKDYIIKLNWNGVFTSGNEKFYPNNNITRGEFVAAIINAVGFMSDADISFDDVEKGSQYYAPVAAAYEKGIIKGINEAIFGLDQNITRQDVAVILFRTANIVGITLPSGSADGFTDSADISDYAADSVGALSAADIINGMPSGEFEPLSFTTRAQAAKLISSIFN